MWEFILRPVAGIVLLGAAALVAHLIKPLIPGGRIKEILYKKHPIVYVPPPAPDQESTPKKSRAE